MLRQDTDEDDPRIRDWTAAYLNGMWAEHVPPAPHSEDTRIDGLLTRAFEIWDAFCRVGRETGPAPKSGLSPLTVYLSFHRLSDVDSGNAP